MTSKGEYTLCSLSFETTSNYEQNLQKLLELIDNAPKNSFVVAPEVCLSGFDYENMQEVCNFSSYATEVIAEHSKDKTVFLTLIECKAEKIYNKLKVFHKGELIHQRSKAKLFTFGGEHHHFEQESDAKVEIIEIEGIKVGVLICFELRFKDLWKKLEGCDLIVVPAWWGKAREDHFKTLTKALAIINQCYVVMSDSKNEECTQISGVVTPQGKESYNGNKPCLCQEYKTKEIALMRRYMDVGIG